MNTTASLLADAAAEHLTAGDLPGAVHAYRLAAAHSTTQSTAAMYEQFAEELVRALAVRSTGARK